MININYSIRNGHVTQDDGSLIATGWSGNHDGKDNVYMTSFHDVGPLPIGIYNIGPFITHPILGPLSAQLTQISGETYGRSGFFIHGPGTTDYGQESKGCVILTHDDRLKVIALNPAQLTVSA